MIINQGLRTVLHIFGPSVDAIRRHGVCLSANLGVAVKDVQNIFAVIRLADFDR